MISYSQLIQVRFSAFLVAQLFADDERLSNVGQQAVATVVGERSKV